MKRNYKVLLVVGILVAGLWSFIPSKKITGDDKDKMLIELLSFVLEKGHFSPIEINDEFSEKMFDAYIELLDSQKKYFLSSDIREFKKYKLKLDNQLIDYDLSFFNLSKTISLLCNIKFMCHYYNVVQL